MESNAKKVTLKLGRKQVDIITTLLNSLLVKMRLKSHPLHALSEETKEIVGLINDQSSEVNDEVGKVQYMTQEKLNKGFQFIFNNSIAYAKWDVGSHEAVVGKCQIKKKYQIYFDSEMIYESRNWVLVNDRFEKLKAKYNLHPIYEDDLPF